MSCEGLSSNKKQENTMYQIYCSNVYTPVLVCICILVLKQVNIN